MDRTLHEELIRCAGIGQRDAARSGTERDWHAVWGIRPFGQKKAVPLISTGTAPFF
ncbi:hypothetical protein [Sphingobacterium thalpophilum]|uniref:hypothetical protein n=1 Tax=Sphingobacterium thalpophilum TaxID=259 RepID=UPI0031E004A7